MMLAAVVDHEVGVRPAWRAVAIPSEHGGWGLTLEPVLLGLLVGWSGAGVAIGVAAFAAFLVRTPLKLVAIVEKVLSQRPGQSNAAGRQDSAHLGQLIVLEACVALAVVGRLVWLAPVAIVIRWWCSSSVRHPQPRRRLCLNCGAIGIAAVAASIVLAAGRSVGLAAGVWLVLLHAAGDPVRSSPDHAAAPRCRLGAVERLAQVECVDRDCRSCR